MKIIDCVVLCNFIFITLPTSFSYHNNNEIVNNSVTSINQWNNITCPSLCACSMSISSQLNKLVKKVNCSQSLNKMLPKNLPLDTELLIMSKNNLMNLHQHIPYLDHLLALDLSNNQINQLSRGHFFFNLIHLKHLDLSFNKFQTLSPGAFRRMKRLENLILSNGQLRYIDEHAFDGLENLRFLDLANNHITYIFLELFQSVLNIHVLNLSRNSISHLKGGVFAPLNCLKKLFLSHNRINSINDNAFVGLDSLEEIYLNDNFLAKVPSIALRSFKRLRYLNLGNNLLKQLISDDFIHTPVEEIWIDRCPELSIIEKMAFWDLPNLKQIHLEFNSQLQFIDPQAFLRVPSLQALYLHNNSLMSLQEDMINNITYLGQQSKVFVNLSSNPLLCDCNIHYIYQCFQSSNINKLELIDGDKLECAQPNDLFKARIKDLKIENISKECKPTLIEGLSSENVTIYKKVGERHTFHCRALGIPVPKINWILPNEKVTSESLANVHKMSHSLRLVHLKLKDSGVYQCRAENSQGSAVISTRLIVDNIDLQIWPLGISSTFVSVVWNGTARSSFPEYQILYKPDDDPSDKYESVTVSHFLHSYTITHLKPQRRYKMCIALRETEINQGYVQLSCTMIETQSQDFMFSGINSASHLTFVFAFSITIVMIFAIFFVFFNARKNRSRKYETSEKKFINNIAQIPLANIPLMSSQ